VIQVIDVAVMALTVHGIEPIITVALARKSEPEIKIVVPPAKAPAEGATLVIDGAF
jgi:hypothetical protein